MASTIYLIRAILKLVTHALYSMVKIHGFYYPSHKSNTEIDHLRLCPTVHMHTQYCDVLRMTSAQFD